MSSFEDYFSIQIFFIILRETLETAIIISVLLSFINQKYADGGASAADQAKNQAVARKLKAQVWIGAVVGLTICLCIGLVFVLAFYLIGQDYWSYTERLWEGVFSLLSSVIITGMGLGLLRINKVMKVKWWIKLGHAYSEDTAAKFTSEDELASFVEDDIPRRQQSFDKRYFLAILPLVTTLREGLEAVVFVGGIGMSHPLTSLPLSIVCGVVLGSIIGWFLYKGGNKMSLQYFLIFSTCFLYLVSAGLMSRGVWFLELETYVRRCGGLDPSETGSGPGSYDISQSVWHVNCCNGLTDGWWMVFNAVLGWTNSATYGSVASYMAYWAAVIVWLEVKLYEEREGYLPAVPIKWQLKRIKKRVALYEHAMASNRQTGQFDSYDVIDSNRPAESNETDPETHQLLSAAA